MVIGGLAQWSASAKAVSEPGLQGNSEWADRYAKEHIELWDRYAARRPRSLQVHLGPSEIGVECDRQVAGKMAGLSGTNHVVDPWPSTRGTALHSEAERVYSWSNEVDGFRWLPETRVRGFEMHPGTSDLYDGLWKVVADHKFLGQRSMDKVRSAAGPPRKYIVQMLTYGQGFRNAGLPVDGVVLLAYPATRASLKGDKGLFAWHRPYTPADDALLRQVEGELAYRRRWALAIMSGSAELKDVPAVVDEHECYYCPFYRPQSAQDGGVGCPGHSPGPYRA